jgi:hypothetical protein
MNRKDRRRTTRTFSNVPLDVYDPKGRMIIGEGQFVNVSLTGSMLQSRQNLRLHQTVRLQVQSPGRSPLEVAGEIVWRKKQQKAFTYGVRFQGKKAALAR